MRGWTGSWCAGPAARRAPAGPGRPPTPTGRPPSSPSRQVTGTGEGGGGEEGSTARPGLPGLRGGLHPAAAGAAAAGPGPSR